MIYFDNSATTLVKPKEVLQMTELALTKYSANPGRSGHKASLATAKQVEYVRQSLADFFNLKHPERVIFTLNCSAALNLAILGSVQPGGHIVCTENEHNSILRPLEHLKNLGKITYSVAKCSDGKVSKEEIEKLIKPNTYLVVTNHISNVNGDIADVKEIGSLCKRKKILYLVDAAQSGGHEKIDMEEFNIDMLAIAGHKGFYSMQGVGALLLSQNANLDPISFGGTGTNSLELVQPKVLPEKFEVGTIATPAILSLGGGLEFVKRNFDIIKEKLDDLTTFLHYEFSKLPVKIYNKIENSNGVFAFNIDGFHSSEVASYLDEKFGICTRAGYHCAPLKHAALNTLDTGAVRVSLSYYNTIAEIERLVFAIKTFLNKEAKS